MPSDSHDDPGHLSLLQRGLYIAGGLGLAASAVRKRPNPLLSVLAFAGGAYLAYRGSLGTCPVKRAITKWSGHAVADRA